MAETSLGEDGEGMGAGGTATLGGGGDEPWGKLAREWESDGWRRRAWGKTVREWESDGWRRRAWGKTVREWDARE